MKNSFDIPVDVKLSYKDGLVSYSMSFGDVPLQNTEQRTMSRGSSDKFVRKWAKVSCDDILKDLIGHGGNLDFGDEWRLSLTYGDDVVSLSGTKRNNAYLAAFIEPIMELLDDTFGATQFVKASRIDCLEIDLLESVDAPYELGSGEPHFGHEEHVFISREESLLSYSRNLPSGCFNNSYECHCENEILQILDQSSTIFEDGSLFRDCIDGDGPLLTFTFHFHDGRSTEVHRTLTRNGTGSQVYDEMLEVIGQVIGCTVFAGGMFDLRIGDVRSKDVPDNGDGKGTVGEMGAKASV